MINLKNYYKKHIIPNCIKTFHIINKYKIPKLEKIQINSGLGIDAEIPLVLKNAIAEFRIITGQHPKTTRTKVAISRFKTKENMPIGLTVTLRNENMYNFLAKLIHLVFPRIRDFNGFGLKQFDNDGNYNFGLTEQFTFPEIDYETVDKIRGYNISIVTNTNDINKNIFLLNQFNFPFEKI
jgi:large subunit ribosomal protein L5